MAKAIVTITGLAIAGLSVAACGSSAPVLAGASPTARVSAVAPKTTAAKPTPKPTRVINSKQQYLADVAAEEKDVIILNDPYNYDSGDLITSPAMVQWGNDLVIQGRNLLSQTWPANARADIRALALDNEKVSADISSQNDSTVYGDDSTATAEAQIVRADLGLGPVPKP
jgi:hypothetical protein